MMRTTAMEFTYASLDNALRETLHEPEAGEGQAAYYLSEMTPEFRVALSHVGFTPDDERQVLIADTDSLDAAAALADEVVWWYDANEDSKSLARVAGRVDPWEKYNLGGDDDVDYNGSYISMIVDACRHIASLS
jgi:hypothetical protein